MDNYQDPKPGKTYISPRLTAFGDSDRKVRIASKVIESSDSYAFAKIRDELVIRHKKDAKSNIIAKFFEDDRGIFVLSIQGYTVATEKPHNASFSFVGDEISKILEFIRNIQSVQLASGSRVNITDEELNRIVLSDNQARNLLHENQKLFAEVIKSEITTEDVVAVGYRKKQLEIFGRLLEDESYFQSLMERANCSKESLWQRYFEKNPWVFGYGLGYVFLTGLDDKKLEQVVQGYSVSDHGKRADALMKTRGLISNLCFVEIKTHDAPLLSPKPYRSGCWAPSAELAGGVSQVQGTVASAVKSLSVKVQTKDNLGDPTGEEVFNYQPKSFLVVGCLDEFIGEMGANEDKVRSFELFRKNTSNPEVITFDELYERAKFIVHHNES